MKNRLLILMIFVFSFNITDAQEINYEIKAYQGTIIEGCIFGHNFEPCYFGCMICDNDTVILDTHSIEDLVESLYSRGMYVQKSANRAYNILYPPKFKEEYIKNYELAYGMESIYADVFDVYRKNIKFKLHNGLSVEISYIMAKGIFLSVKDDKSREKFRTSVDIDIEDLSFIKAYLVPIDILEYGPSEQVFIINGCHKDDSD